MKYDDYSDVWNTWVKADKLRVRAATTGSNSTPQPQAIYAAGDVVEYFEDRKWHLGKIKEVKDGKYKFSYDGYSSVWDVWTSADKLRAVAGHAGTGNPVRTPQDDNTPTPPIASVFAAGSMVDINWDGRWYYGRVLQVKDGKYFVTYDNYSKNWDTWVTVDKLRTPAPKTHRINATKEAAAAGYGSGTGFGRFKPGDKVLVRQSGNTWRYAMIKGLGEKGSLFDNHYLTVEIDEYTGQERSSNIYTWYEHVAGLVKEPWWTQRFTGVWEIRIPVAMVTRTDDYTKTTTVTGGATQPPLTILPNGTYTWKVPGKTITGKWIPAEKHPGITILKGDRGADWSVYLANDASTQKHFKRDIIYLETEGHTYKEGYRLK